MGKAPVRTGRMTEKPLIAGIIVARTSHAKANAILDRFRQLRKLLLVVTAIFDLDQVAMQLLDTLRLQ